ncbi:haloacid dehalogenase type II [uncultured Pseudokineococcus sp.]|uniref:haloacid dehalogenase type II n=1 Tax=uncultured Pseudokineococcus sp. TaxID=1642928 RepID=UPI002608D8BA|nr:haloacid dehalogenase type II [uncultured Pseudokineococcus sp.]
MSALSTRPDVVLLDVNETLSDTAPMARAFEDVGAPGSLAATWFAGVLRDGFARTAAGAAAPFADVAAGALRTVLEGVDGLGPALDDAVSQVMDAFTQLPAHPDVAPGLAALRASGLHVATLTNGATAVSDGLLRRAGARDSVDQLLSVQDAPGGAWKPAPAAYEHGLRATGSTADRAVLVAVHPWDVDGAARAGLRTAWLDRSGRTYPSHLTAPDVTAPSLTALAELLSR